MSGANGSVTPWSWARSTPFGRYLKTETVGAAALLVATAAAPAWANLSLASYNGFRSAMIAIQVGAAEISAPVVEWVNSGLMTLFFFVVGLEARREWDLGELRERRRIESPVLAGIAGMVGAVGVYLLVNAGSRTAGGWGVAMSTDTAFALAIMTIARPLFPDRLRGFLLTVVIVDDVVALLVIAFVYTA